MHNRKGTFILDSVNEDGDVYGYKYIRRRKRFEYRACFEYSFIGRNFLPFERWDEESAEKMRELFREEISEMQDITKEWE